MIEYSIHHTPRPCSGSKIKGCKPMQRIITQADVIRAEVPPEHAAAARALQEALMELVGEADDDGDDSDEPVPAPCGECEPESSAQEAMATAYFERVREELAWSAESGALPSPPLAVLKASYHGCAGAWTAAHGCAALVGAHGCSLL